MKIGLNKVRIFLPGVSLGQTSPNGDGVSLGFGFGDTHIGTQRRRFDGLPWLWTGSKSRDLFKVAQAILDLVNKSYNGKGFPIYMLDFCCTRAV